MFLRFLTVFGAFFAAFLYRNPIRNRIKENKILEQHDLFEH